MNRKMKHLDHEHEVFIECEELKEVANSLATHDSLLYK